jgi:hypothetical protein
MRELGRKAKEKRRAEKEAEKASLQTILALKGTDDERYQALTQG